MSSKILRLYVVGNTPSASKAIEAIQNLLDTHLAGSWQLEVLDVKDAPEQVEADRIMAVPALMRVCPPPKKRVVGDMSNHEQILLGLDLSPEDD
jgi:circadian clock protein KaiB